jgi:hypothetical protein
VGEFIFFFFGYLLFVGFFGMVFTRTDAFPGSGLSQGDYPETLFFWVVGISAFLAFLTVNAS